MLIGKRRLFDKSSIMMWATGTICDPPSINVEWNKVKIIIVVEMLIMVDDDIMVKNNIMIEMVNDHWSLWSRCSSWLRL